MAAFFVQFSLSHKRSQTSHNCASFYAPKPLLLHRLSEQTSLRLAVLMNKISNQKGLRKRSFEIIRKPDLIGSFFLFNNVKVRYVATCPETGISFYANNGQGGVVGVRVHPNGRKVLTNATCETTPNGKYNAKRKQRYLQFKNAFGHGKHILVSHAVYIAWRDKEIPAGMTIDHIDGVTTNNDVRNLRCVSNAINSRDGGFLKKLRNKGINPPEIRRPYLLRYFDRMAFIKENIPRHRYKHLDRADLMTILFYDLPVIYAHFEKQYHLTLPFKLGLL